MGINAVAESYADIENTNFGIHQPSSLKKGPGTFKDGKLLYKDIVDNYQPPNCDPSHWDDATKSTSIYCSIGKVWISPQLAADVLAKATYVKSDLPLAGMMIWHLGADKQNEKSLLHVIAMSLGR